MQCSEYSNKPPLRFKISDWHQLPKCKSNNSNRLHIEVADLLQNNRLTGERITLLHEEFGTLFSCVVNAKGSLISTSSETGLSSFELSTSDILKELAKYGYIIEYSPAKALPSAQLSYLITLNQLGYEKIRILNVHILNHRTLVEYPKSYIVAFNVSQNSNWINNDYIASNEEFCKALVNGSAINISDISQSKQWDWDWLKGYVASIIDILEDNAQ